MEQYTLLEAVVNGPITSLEGSKYIPVELKKVEFVGFKPNIHHNAYYQIISKEKAKKHMSEEDAEMVCDVIVYYDDLPSDLKKGDSIRAYMDKSSIAIADKLEKILGGVLV